jgi:hypothetical protein
MEATAIEKIEELITRSQTDGAPKLFPLDQPEFEIAISTPNLTLWHKLRKPTLSELIERDQQMPYETEEVSAGEDRLNIDDEGPNARLWDKIAVAVKGYRGQGLAVNDWNGLTPEIKALMPTGHKSAAIRGLYNTTFEVEQDEAEGFALGEGVFTVKQTFGDYIIRHVMRAPTESERRDFRRRANETRFARGSRKIKTKVLTNLKAYVELYDKLIENMEGVTGGAIAQVDPVWKRGAVDCLMRSFDASLSD